MLTYRNQKYVHKKKISANMTYENQTSRNQQKKISIT